MLLKKLINNLPEEKKNIQIKGLEINSKKIKKGYIFFAIKGQNFNGENYIGEAVKKGAVLVICSKKNKYKNKKILIKKVSNIRHFLSLICSKYYKSKPKNIIAVTGTNGKSSVADLFYQICNLNNVPSASIGTLGIKYKGKIIKSNLTSPDTISLHKALTQLKKNNIDNVIIEASSHGIHQNRIDNLNLKAGIFTNLSQDHLDYHKTMKSYLETKLLLFKNILKKNKVLISDKTIKEFSILKKISEKKNLKLIEISKIEKKLKNSDFVLNQFQIKNLSMAIVAAKLCKIKEKKIFNSIYKIKDVNGRLELVKIFHNNVRVFVDFAHTPDALLKTLQVLKNDYNENISLVFGCGGDRDFKKRPLMAKIASSNCKKIFVTDDNPRNEKPEKIRDEIIRNIKNKNCFNIGDRSKAIKIAIDNAEPNEIILVAGKGHETEQIYKTKIISSSDRKIIKNLKFKKNKISKKNQSFEENKKVLKSIHRNIKVKDFHGLAIDSREVKKNNLFLTIKGKKNNGINFIKQAIKKGAKYIISSQDSKNFKNRTIKVKSEINFLNKFATKKRELTNAKIIAITGSAGKTSLKNLSQDLLKNFGETFSSPKSYNNHYGVPLSISSLETKHKFGVFEIGMSKLGEINSLSKLIKPHIGIITNIGEAHIENFPNLKGIAHAKSEIINNIYGNGTIILNKDDRFFSFLEKKAKSKGLKIVTFGIQNKSDFYLSKIIKVKKNDILIVKAKGENLKLNIKNLNTYNVLSSLALLDQLNVNLKKAVRYYESCGPTEGRGKIFKIKRYNKQFRLIDESYNANPLSVKTAIKNFNSIKKKNFKKYLLLGDMLELGNHSNYLHSKISKLINNSDIDKVFIKGNKVMITYQGVKKEKRGNIFQTNEDVDFTLKNIISNNDYLMIKGSNATGLQNLSKKMIKGN